MNWREYEVGQEVAYFFNEFDGSGVYKGIITEKHDDHRIVHVNDSEMNLWLDDNNADMFI